MSEIEKYGLLVALIVAASIFMISIFAMSYRAETRKEVILEIVYIEKEPTNDISEVEDEPPEKVEIVEIEDPIEIESDISKGEIELLALITMAEAEGEPDEGKRLVIDTVLNRVDSPYFPDTIHDVIYQKNQFSSVWNGRLERCYVDEDILRLVLEELESRTNSEVVYFRTNHYSNYGEALLQVGNHYFSGH